jgi:LuxR family maltose regulon positive regulatory protein
MRSRLVDRERLVGRLREGRGRRLTLVCAPAGYGKTTLLGQWEAKDAARPFVWLTLDQADSDPVRLWRHVITALHTAHPPVGARSLTPLEGGPNAISPIVLPLLLHELADAPPLVLVLEDWHAVVGALCDDTMRILVEQAPEQLQIVITSRSDPGLPLARLRARGEVAEVRAQHLSFSTGEAAALLQGSDVNLEPDAVESLTLRTEGWAAGLHLAVLMLQEHPHPQAFVEMFSGGDRHVFDYLSEEVLRSVASDLRGFMLRSSVLERLSAPLCDGVLERSDSAALLGAVERANLFLVPLDDTGDLYRYHGLFLSMLRRELARQEPGLAESLHARASVWFEEQGDIEQAIDHAIAGRHVDRASDLVTRDARRYWSSGRITTLTRWLEALSWPEAVGDPQLALMRGTVLGMGGHRTESIERWLSVASASPFDRRPANGLASIESGISLLRSLFLTAGLGAAERAALRACELESPESPWRRQALLGLAQVHYLLGRPDDAAALLREAHRLPNAHSEPAGAALVLAYLGLVELVGGRSRAAARYGREALAFLAEHHMGASHIAATPHLVIGAALAAGTDLHRALEHAEAAVELSAPVGPHYWHAHALLRLADVRHRLGDATGAEEALTEARSELSALPDGGMLNDLLAQTEQQLNRRARREGFLGEDLTESELRVLRALATEGSLQAAARSLYLSTNTVKTHRRTIYRKLGATTREEALNRAAELALLDESGSVHPG